MWGIPGGKFQWLRVVMQSRERCESRGRQTKIVADTDDEAVLNEFLCNNVREFFSQIHPF